MERKLLIEKLNGYIQMREDLKNGELPEEAKQQIDELEAQILDLRSKQEEIKEAAFAERTADIEKVDHYIDLLNELIREDDSETEEVLVDEKTPEEAVEEASVEEAVIEEVENKEPVEEKPVSRFPQFNVR